MKKIVVGFSKSKKKFPLWSWLIQLYQNTHFSHTYIRLLSKPKFPSDKILHASEGLVQNMSETIFNIKHQVTDEFELEIPDVLVLDKITSTEIPMYNALINILHETSGDDYGIMQNIGIIYVDFMRWAFNVRAKNPFSRGWNCSEFVAFVLKVVYPQYFSDIDPNTVTPKEIYYLLNRMEKSGRYKIQRR